MQDAGEYVGTKTYIVEMSVVICNLYYLVGVMTRNIQRE